MSYSSGLCQICYKKSIGYIYPKWKREPKTGCPSCGRKHPGKTVYCVDCNMRSRNKLSYAEKLIVQTMFNNEPCILLENRGKKLLTCKSCGWKRFLINRKCAECISKGLKRPEESILVNGEVEKFLLDAKDLIIQD